MPSRVRERIRLDSTEMVKNVVMIKVKRIKDVAAKRRMNEHAASEGVLVVAKRSLTVLSKMRTINSIVMSVEKKTGVIATLVECTSVPRMMPVMSRVSVLGVWWRSVKIFTSIEIMTKNTRISMLNMSPIMPLLVGSVGDEVY